MKALFRYFAQGVLIAAPIAMTLYLVYAIVKAVDGFLGLGAPGLGLVVTLALLTTLGFVASSVIGTRLLTLPDRVLKRLPLVKILYTAIKDLVGAFVGNRKSFNRPVAVQLPGGLGAIFGFATRDSLAVLGLDGHVAVYFPQSYNFAGNLIAVPRAQVTPLDVKSSELMTFVVSGGVTGLGVKSEAPGPT
jgi:uncharacterized membrane protein